MSTWKWTSTYCLSHGAILNLTIDYTSLGGQLLPLDGLLAINTVCWDPTYAPTPNVSAAISIPDEVQYKGLAANAGTVNSNSVCQIIQNACVGSNQQYTSLSDCVDYMATKPTVYGVCPTSQDSDTVNCRFLHSLVAQLPAVAPGEPSPAIVHCPHTGKNSMVCINRCLPACSNCTSTQSCLNIGTDPLNPVYSCVCNTGYKAAAGGGCQAVTCTQNYQCNSTVSGNNIALCNTTNGINQCYCNNTWHWNATSGSCYCPSDHFVSWAAPNPPQCIPIGRCYDRYECVSTVPGNSYSSLSCITYGTNAYAPYNTCVCNPGYQGGFSYPCYCPTPTATPPGNYKEEWSNLINGNVCLAPGQCANDYDCTSPKTCVGQPLGTCQ